MHTDQPIDRHPRTRLLTAALSVAAALLLSGTAFAQQKDASDKSKSDGSDAAKAFVGKFGAGGMTIIIEQHEGKFRGTITRGGQPFTFTGELKGTSFSGLIDVDGAQTGFAATIAGDELTLKLGLDSYKLARGESRPSRPVAPSANTVRKEVLLAMSEDVQVGSVLVSPDNRKVAYIIQRDGLRYVAVNGVEGKPFRRASSIGFSLDSSRYFYVGQRADGKLQLVVDEIAGDPCDDVGPGPAHFSPDSKRVAYAALRDGKWRTVIDGKESAPYDAIRFITFSPDSRRTAFAGKRGDNWHVIVDGVEQGEFADVGADGIHFSPDSRQVAYTAIKGLRHCLVVNGQEGKTHEAIVGFCFSPDGLHNTYIVLRDRKFVVIHDGQEKATYEAIDGMSISPDSKRIALGVRIGGKAVHVIDGQIEPAYDRLSPPLFSPDSLHVVYAGFQNGKWRLVRDGRKGLAHDEIPMVAFSPDSKRLAYLAVDNKRVSVVIDSDVLPLNYDHIWRNGLTFSPDSRHLVYGGARNSNSYLVIDGAEGEPIGEFLPGSQPVFDAPDQFHVIIRRGSSFYRLEVQIGEPSP